MALEQSVNDPAESGLLCVYLAGREELKAVRRAERNWRKGILRRVVRMSGAPYVAPRTTPRPFCDMGRRQANSPFRSGGCARTRRTRMAARSQPRGCPC